MKSPALIARTVAIAVSGVWALAIWITGLDLDQGIRRWMVYLPSVVGFGVVVWDLWLWKTPGISKITGHPRLYGTWKVTLTPSQHSRIPKAGNRGPISGAMVIDQTFWTLAIQFHTEQSTSGSVTASLVPQRDSRNIKDLYFTYTNRARQEHNQRSIPHHGTCLLQVAGTEPTAMDGSYWTDRLTTGDMTLQRVDRKRVRSAQDARQAVGLGSV